MPPATGLTVIARGVGDVEMINAGAAPQQAMGMTYLANANSIALVMGNAAFAQQRGQLIGATALAKVIVRILSAGSGPP
ncbi:MAG: RebB family R body protein [Sphingomonadales bacterium]|nr:RebB family R body protein [Sphingomonadales bacterium]